MVLSSRKRKESMKKHGFLPLLIFPALLFSRTSGTVQNTDMKIHAIRLQESVNLDGRLDEAVWQNGYGVSRFVQRDPVENVDPTEQTTVHVAYDDEALYVGARLHDSSPDSIVAQLGRRDASLNADLFVFFVDPYFDKRTGYYFGLNAGGTQYDGILYNDEWDDNSWDGVWEGRVSNDQSGWSAEMRIPFSQLRFKEQDEHVWGVNFRRDIQRRNERDYLVFTPRNSSGFVSRFPSLVGLRDLVLPKRLEILPYVRTKAEFTHPDIENPFHDGSEYRPDMGLDMKYGIGSNLTLDLTVNPDFGQVEVDPAVVNLSDVETFFSEKRPFFIEGASIFNFGHGGSRSFWGFNWWEPDFFYSRRIGRTPQAETPDYDYADMPEGAHILGAAKLTGKLWGNWNVGTLHAMTKKETGSFSSEGSVFDQEVEPLTYYGVFRMQRELNDARQGIGMISTMTARKFSDSIIREDINGTATTFGIDGWTFLDTSRTWVISGWVGGSRVTGTPERMIALQQNPRHYFQRPDASHVSVDSTATSMTGLAARLWLNKQKGHWLLNAAVGALSPKFDVNDIGFMSRSDWINSHLGIGYQWTEPGSWYRYIDVISAIFASADFGWNITSYGFWQLAEIQFLNYWYLESIFGFYPDRLDNRLTRGGPLSRAGGDGYEADIELRTDERKPWVFETEGYVYSRGPRNGGRSFEIGVLWKPKSNLSVELSPEIARNEAFAQWIDVFDDATAENTYGHRYVFGEMRQTQFNANIRLNWTFTPKLSLQLFLQPLISHGDYTHFKELARPSSYDFNIYEDRLIDFNGEDYTIDPDGNGPAGAFTFSEPDFFVKSLRGNAVFRWEYRPGSTLYLVWTQSRIEDEYDDTFSFNRGFRQLWRAKADNIFMLKMTYWFSM